jgi:hypothetical protein
MSGETATIAKLPMAPGQFRVANAIFPGLVVLIVKSSPYLPGHWICRSHPSGGRLVLSADELGEEVPNPGSQS